MSRTDKSAQSSSASGLFPQNSVLNLRVLSVTSAGSTGLHIYLSELSVESHEPSASICPTWITFWARIQLHIVSFVRPIQMWIIFKQNSFLNICVWYNAADSTWPVQLQADPQQVMHLPIRKLPERSPAHLMLRDGMLLVKMVGTSWFKKTLKEEKTIWIFGHIFVYLCKFYSVGHLRIFISDTVSDSSRLRWPSGSVPDQDHLIMASLTAAQEHGGGSGGSGQFSRGRLSENTSEELRDQQWSTPERRWTGVAPLSGETL